MADTWNFDDMNAVANQFRTMNTQQAPRIVQGVQQAPGAPSWGDMLGAEYTPDEMKTLARAGMKKEYMGLYGDRLKQARDDMNTPMPTGDTMKDGSFIANPGGSMDTGLKNYNGMMKTKELEGKQDSELKGYESGALTQMQAIARFLRNAFGKTENGQAVGAGDQGENISIPTEY
jgi:hypothetical protein